MLNAPFAYSPNLVEEVFSEVGAYSKWINTKSPKTCYSAHLHMRGHLYAKGHANIRLPLWEGVSTLKGLATLLCSCSYHILCELRREGERLGSVVFFDDGPQSETRSQQVTSCPGCGEKLGLHLLRAQKNPSP